MGYLNRSLKQTMLLQTPNKGVSVEQNSSILLNREFGAGNQKGQYQHKEQITFDMESSQVRIFFTT